MSHSLNNAKAGRFMARTSEFSTHGSRRGVVELAPAIESDSIERLRELRSAHQSMNHRLQAEYASLERDGFTLPGRPKKGGRGNHLRKMLERRSVPAWAVDRVREVVRLCDQMRSLQDELTALGRRGVPREDFRAAFLAAAGKLLSQGQFDAIRAEAMKMLEESGRISPTPADGEQSKEVS